VSRRAKSEGLLLSADTYVPANPETGDRARIVATVPVHISIPIRQAIHRLAVAAMASETENPKAKPCCGHGAFDTEMRDGIPHQVCRECGHAWMSFDVEGL